MKNSLEDLKRDPLCAQGEAEMIIAAMLRSASVEVTGPHDDSGGTISITLHCRKDPRVVAAADAHGRTRLTPELLRLWDGTGTTFERMTHGEPYTGIKPELRALATRFCFELEAHDRKVCTGPIVNGEVQAKTQAELAAMSLNWRKLSGEFQRKALELGYSLTAWTSARMTVVRGFNYDEELAQRSLDGSTRRERDTAEAAPAYGALP